MDPTAKSLLAVDKVDAHSSFIAGPDHAIVKWQMQSGQKLVSFVPVNFSQLPRLFEEIIRLDTFVITVAPMGQALGPRSSFDTYGEAARAAFYEFRLEDALSVGGRVHPPAIWITEEN